MKKLLLFLLISWNVLSFGQKSCFDKETVLFYQDALGKDTSFKNARNNLAFLEGCKFPESGFNDLNGGKLNISAFKSELVFINFWFKSCAPCIEEMPAIVELCKKFSEKKVQFINVSTDKQNDLEAYIMSHSMPGVFQTYQDRDFLLNNYAAAFGYPMYFLIDKGGNVIKAWTGSYTTKEFYNMVKYLIDENL